MKKLLALLLCPIFCTAHPMDEYAEGATLIHERYDWLIERAPYLKKAAHFAAQKHQGQYRKDAAKTPYIVHPLGVAKILMEEGGVTSPVVLKAALLHDTLEDTSATEEEIAKLFGKRVLGIVKEVTNDPSLSGEENKMLQIAHAPSMSQEAKLVKLADRLYNVRDLCPPPPAWTAEKVAGYYDWGQKLLDALEGTNPILEALLQEEIDAHS